MKKVLLGIMAVVVMTFALAGCDTGTPTTTVVTTTQLQEQLTALDAKLITLENNQSTSVKQADLSTIKSDISTLKSQIAGITSGVTQSQVTSSINSALASVLTRLTEIEADIAELQTPDATTPPVVTGKVEATIQHFYPFPFNAVAGETSSTTYRVTVTNGTNVTKSDIQLQAFFIGSAPFSLTANPTFAGASIIGGASPLVWMYSNQFLVSNNALFFGNGLGLTLVAGETKTFDFVLTVKSDSNVSFSAQMFVVS